MRLRMFLTVAIVAIMIMGCGSSSSRLPQALKPQQPHHHYRPDPQQHQLTSGGSAQQGNHPSEKGIPPGKNGHHQPGPRLF